MHIDPLFQTLSELYPTNFLGPVVVHMEDFTWVFMLLNLLNELGKAVKCKACQAFIAFSHEFDKFNNTRAQMLDSIYHRTLKRLNIAFLAWKHQAIASFSKSYEGRHNVM